MNVTIQAPVVFDDLVKQAQEIGIEPRHVIEAALHHIALGCMDTSLNRVIQAKVVMLQQDLMAQGMSPVNAAEAFMTGLPVQILGLIQAMQQHGVMDEQRAAANWLKLESLIMQHLPEEVRSSLQRRTAPAAGTATDGEGSDTD